MFGVETQAVSTGSGAWQITKYAPHFIDFYVVIPLCFSDVSVQLCEHFLLQD